MYKPAYSDDKPGMFHGQAGRVLRTGLPCSDTQPCMLHTFCANNTLFYKHISEKEEVFRLCFRFATAEDDPQEVQALSATQLFERMKAAHPSAMRDMTFLKSWKPDFRAIKKATNH